jgi:hypothetical protein
MEKSSKRGKIPQSDWPLIMARYEAGETLASIARTYDCSPPAISYVVSRSRARSPGTETPARAPSAAEAQLIKASPGEPAAPTNGQPTNGQPGAAPVSPAQTLPEAAPQAAAAGPDGRRGENWPPATNGLARNGAGARNANPPTPNLPGLAPRAALPPQRPPAAPLAGQADGDQRRTLHLSLGNVSPGNGGTPPVDHAANRQSFTGDGQPAQPQLPNNRPPQYQAAGERPAPPVNSGLPHHSAPPDRGRDGAGLTGFSEPRPAYHGPVQRTEGDLPQRKDASSSYIDKELRARVDGDIAAFLAAFDAALVEDTQESRSALREATDRLLRAGARTRIELERLEARMPLPPRNNISRSEPAWRPR